MNEYFDSFLHLKCSSGMKPVQPKLSEYESSTTLKTPTSFKIELQSLVVPLYTILPGVKLAFILKDPIVSGGQ